VVAHCRKSLIASPDNPNGNFAAIAQIRHEYDPFHE
jgi:hypothetical protein